MNTTQDFTQIEQVKQGSFEPQKSENIFTALFNDCNEEERKIINEFSQFHGIRTNDAVWIFVKVFFKINRENNTLQQKISETLDVNQSNNKFRVDDIFFSLTFTCAGIFFLCLISFIGGAAVAGKGWGHSPVEALLNAPAGWIIPLALIPVGGFAFFRGLTEQGKIRLINLTIALIVTVLFLCVLIQIL